MPFPSFFLKTSFKDLWGTSMKAKTGQREGHVRHLPDIRRVGAQLDSAQAKVCKAQLKSEKAMQHLKNAKWGLEEAYAEEAAAEVNKTLPVVDRPEVAHELTGPEVPHLHRLVAVTLEARLGESASRRS